MDITSALWGPFHYEIRVLNFLLPNEHKQAPQEYWKEQEEKISKMLGTIRHTMTSFSSIGSLPPATAELGFLGLVGGWVVAEDGSQDGAANMKRRKWAGILGWQNETCERKAWGEDNSGPGQECLQSLVSSADGAGQRWHAVKFELLGDGNQKYALSSSDEDDT